MLQRISIHCCRVLLSSPEEQAEASREAQRRALAFGNKKFCDAFWNVFVFAGILREENKKDRTR
jgi:uncharacterized membrane protein YjjP (DUF1212 family)